MEFDKLIKEYLSSLNEAPISGDISQIAPEIVSKATDAPTSGHWKLLKKQENMEKAVIDILNHVLPENNNTYNPDIDTPEELKKAIQDAVEEITTKKGWAAKFLTDRLSTIVLKKVAFDVASQAMTSKKEVTQKEVKQALNKALEQKPATASTEEDAVYYRSADLDSEDTDLVKAFNKLPAEGNIKWSEVVGKVGEDLANQLKKAGALIEVVGGEEEEDEEKEIPALEFDDEDEDVISNFDRVIDPYFSTTKDDYFRD